MTRFRWLEASAFLLLCVTTVLWRTLETPYEANSYRAAILSFNYIDMGLVRRGLAGTIALLFSRDPFEAAARFHVASAACLAGICAWLILRSPRPLVERIAAALLLIMLFRRLSIDVGRTDFAALIFICAGAALVASRRPGIGAALLAAGLPLHELSFILGLPLFAAVLLERGSWRTLPWRSWVAIALAIVAGLAIYLVTGLAEPNPVELAAPVRNRFPASDLVDFALYFQLSGGRGLAAALCMNRSDPAYALHVLEAFGLVGLSYFALCWRTRPGLLAALVATAPPLAFLCVVATDVARWGMLTTICLCILVLLTEARARPKGMVLLVALPVLALTGNHDLNEFTAIPRLDALAARFLGVRVRPPLQTVDQCDPRWRQLIAPNAGP